MIYLILGAILVAAFYSATGRKVMRRYANWRVANAVLAAGVFAAAGFEAMRGGLAVGIVLSVIAMGLTASARWPRQSGPIADAMSPQQARDILGVAEGASPQEIKAAYTRLMQRVHPDKGGAPGLAVQLNLARDVLLKP